MKYYNRKEKATALQNLLYQTALTQEQFAEVVGVKVGTLRAQLKKKNTLDLAYKYMPILGIKTIKGYESECYVELVVS